MIKLLVFDMGNTIINQVDDTDRSLLEYEPLEVLKGVEQALSALAKRYRLVVLSNTYNTTSTQMMRVCEHLGLGALFERAFTSLSLCSRKPSPAAFLAVLRYARVDPSEAVMIGNSYEEDILGAAAVGMRSILVTASTVTMRTPADLVVPSVRDITCASLSRF